MPTINTNFLAKGNYNNGKRATSSYDLPASSGWITVTIDASEMTKEGQRVHLGCEVSRDNGVTWSLFASIVVEGAPVRPPSRGDPNKPTQTVWFDFDTAVKLRVFCDVAGGPFQFGLSGSLVYV